ncbi:MAG: hypothetical protein WCD76_11190, partial [Pyrinomonadaceae bacterium]
MSDTATNKSPATNQASKATDARRRVLVIGEETNADNVSEGLSADYETACASPEEAARIVSEFEPALALIAFGNGEDEARLLVVARRLRAGPATHALPLVFLFSEDNRALRHAALNIGADDYFARATAHAEMRARLEALFWRVEAGRRTVPLVAEQRLEIDNFLLLLEHIGADAQEGAGGTLALVGMAEDDARSSEAESVRV